MSLNEEERAILVAREYEKAQQFCKDIGNAELGFWNVVANRLYYALFHAVSAMLINDHHQVGTHKRCRGFVWSALCQNRDYDTGGRSYIFSTAIDERKSRLQLCL